MAKSANQKQKLIRLMQLLYAQTDETHFLSTDALIAQLEGYGIAAERKSIYSDIETLRACGCDIERRGGEKGGYYIAGRDFELPELKLLVDAVQSSRFLTQRKSAALIAKVERLASAHQAQSLQRQVYVAGRIKTMNESIYYNVDGIHAAITAGKMIGFRYFQWAVGSNCNAEKQYRHGGARYEISPWALLWEGENYYMLGFDAVAGSIRHYRVDKMESIAMLKRPRAGQAQFEKFDMGAYTRRVFGMFRGEQQTLTLRCAAHLLGVMRDRFGADMTLRRDEDAAYFRVIVQVDISPQFYGWLCGLGAEVCVFAPENAAQAYRAYLQDTLAAQRFPEK